MSHYAKLKPCRMLRDDDLRKLLGQKLWYLPETIFEDEGIFWVEAINEESEMVTVPLVCLELSQRQIQELKENRELPERAFKHSLLTKDYYVPASLA
jgi:hypothetical protein